jgi:hypothetical protein
MDENGGNAALLDTMNSKKTHIIYIIMRCSDRI